MNTSANTGESAVPRTWAEILAHKQAASTRYLNERLLTEARDKGMNITVVKTGTCQTVMVHDFSGSITADTLSALYRGQ